LSGVLITIEGVEGSGKSTQIQILSARLRNLGLPVVLSKEPGGTELGKELRALLLTPHTSGERWSPTAELLLFYADRAQHLSMVVRPALEDGKVVLIDRFDDSSWAYQGTLGIRESTLNQLREMVLEDLKADLTLVMDLDPEESLQRVAARNTSQGSSSAESRFDLETIGFHRNVRKRFKEIAHREPGRVVLIPAIANTEAVGKDIWAHVSATLTLRGFMVG